MQFGTHHQKNKEVYEHDRVRRDQSQPYDGVCAPPHHFVGRCEDRKSDGLYHISQKNWIKSEIHPPPPPPQIELNRFDFKIEVSFNIFLELNEDWESIIFMRNEK
jgi:hypothetical protein